MRWRAALIVLAWSSQALADDERHRDGVFISVAGMVGTAAQIEGYAGWIVVPDRLAVFGSAVAGDAFLEDGTSTYQLYAAGGRLWLGRFFGEGRLGMMHSSASECSDPSGMLVHCSFRGLGWALAAGAEIVHEPKYSVDARLEVVSGSGDDGNIHDSNGGFGVAIALGFY